MTMFLAPYTAIADIDGSPLDAGFLFFGESGKNPESFPIPIYWDADFTIPAAQPIRTRNGYPIRNGSPCKIYLKQAEHSLVIKNKNLSAILVEMNNKGISSSLLVRPNGDTVETSLTNIDAELNNKQQQIDDKPSQQYVDEELDLKAPKETTYTKLEVDTKINAEATRAQVAEQVLQDQVNSVGVGNKAYKTYALMDADKANIPAKSKVTVTNDATESNNGDWQWDGTSFTKSAYDPKTQAIAESKDYTDQQIANTEKTKISVKNLFDPRTVISGSSYDNDGTIFYNAARRRTIKYPVAAGEWISISGMDGMPGSTQNTLQLWSIAGATFVSKVDLPTALTTTEFSTQIPNGVTHISFNINGTEVPPKLQLEKSQKPTSYEPYYLLETGLVATQLDSLIAKKSIKNLWNGKAETKARFINSGVQTTSNENDVITSFIPVEFGKYYTISGLDLSKIESNYQQIHAYSNNLSLSANWVKRISAVFGNTTTFYVDDPSVKYVLLPMLSSTLGVLSDAHNLALQIEEGQVATSYEPSRYSEDALKLYKASLEASLNNVKSVQPRFVNEFVELNKVRNAFSSVTSVAKDLMPTGVGYIVEGQSGIENASNNLYAQIQSAEKGKKGVYAHLMKFLAGTPTLGTLKPTAFTIPSGQFDNDGTLASYSSRYSKAEYAHPNIAYDGTGVAGFKYWMISSILPANNQGDVVWEDEDLFVSNDAKNWQRVRSLYESDKSYTTATLRLPPHSLTTVNARKYAFLPCPAVGDVIEISVPADNGAAALERVNITLTALPWKHDPAILIDGGYVYTYHSFHLPYVDRDGGKNRFIVCVRTNDGINWEVVRTDGSIMLLTEENSRTIFTKDDQGRYNYMYYAYSRPYSNPEVVKWGENDYELYYGENFQFRVKGTKPYSFDFGTTYPIGPTASANHPGLLRSGSNLYLINNAGVYKSTDRGATLTKLPSYPMWLGGVSGIPYKKALCVGDGGKVILVEAQRFHMQQFSMPAENQFSATNDANFMSLYEFASVAAFEGFAQNGLVDAYIDVQLCKVNLTSQKREYFVMPALSLKNTTTIVNRPLQRLKICDMNFERGDTLHMYVTLNSRNGAKIVFGGIDIS